jgi:hypothetical protein
MKVSLLFVSMVLTVGCGYKDPQAFLAQRTMQYQIDPNKYAVIVIQDDISEEIAKKEAMRKAAEMTLANGYRYFVIESESEAMAARSNSDNFNRQPANIYYELIQSGNFGRERVDQPQPPMGEAIPGWRIEFSTYKDPVTNGVDACQYAQCRK